MTRNLDCCVAKPRIICRVCKGAACSRHYLMFKKAHPPAKMLTPSGREIFFCPAQGGKGVSYFFEFGIVILDSPQDILNNYNPPEVPPEFRT